MNRLATFLAAVMITLAAPCAVAQDVAVGFAERGPRFLLGGASAPVRIDVARTPLLRQRITLELNDVSMHEALLAIARQSGLQLMYSDRMLASDRRVTLRAEAITVAAALTEVLLDAEVDVLFSRTGNAALIRRSAALGVVTGTIRGRVTDSSNVGIAGVGMSVEGTRLGTTSGMDGAYAINGVSVGSQTVVARRLGYRTQSRTVLVSDSASVTADFVLVRAPTILSEIVVTPTGDRQRLEVGNAIGTIKADSIVPLTLIRNMSDLLQARTPGVVVSNSTGMVGAPSKVRVRGLNSIRLNNDPIIILDGMRLVSQTTQAESQVNTGAKIVAVAAGSAGNIGAGFVGTQWVEPLVPSRLDDIDPNSIESIDVLRGPSAASLYGTEAANGVIVIKTKKGSSGPMRLALTADNGWSYVPGRLPDSWFGWGHLANGGLTTSCRLSGGPGSTNVADGTCTQDSVTSFNPQNHPEMKTLGTGTSRNIAANLSGGTQQLQQFMSVRLADNDGIPKMSEVEKRRFAREGRTPPPWVLRPNTESNVNASSRTTLRAGSNLDFSLTASGIYRDVLNNSWSGSQSPATGFTIVSPADTLQYVSAEGARARIGNVSKRGYASASGHYAPLDWLTIRGTLGGDYALRTDESLVRASECVGLRFCTSARSSTRNETFVTTMDIGAQLAFAPLSWMTSRTSIGEQYNNTKFTSLFAGNTDGTNLAFGSQLLSPSPVATSATTQLYQVSESRDEGATAGWYFEQMIAVRQRLFVTAAFRQDVASAFGASVNDRAPVYPKLGASWLLSEEPFFPASRIVSSLRLRAAYGHSGQQAAQGDVFNNYQINTTWVRGATVPGVVLSQLGNPGLKPERTKEWEGGFDLSLFDNERVHMEGTLYRKLSEDAIVSTTLPASYGTVNRFLFSNLVQRQNIGSVENRGVELSISARVVDSRAVAWDVTVNATKNANKLVHKSPTAMLSPYSFRQGYPIYGHFGPRVLSYADLDGDGVLAFSEVAFSDTTLIGKPYPSSELTYASTLALFSGAVRVNANFDQVNDMATNFRSDTRAMYDRTTPLAEQAAAFESVAFTCCVGGGYRNEVSALRFAELSVTYNLPAAMVRRLVRVQTASLTFAGRNLALWTNYAGMDPNVDTWLGAVPGGFSEQASDGGSLSVIPQPRNWTVRVNLGF